MVNCDIMSLMNRAVVVRGVSTPLDRNILHSIFEKQAAVRLTLIVEKNVGVVILDKSENWREVVDTLQGSKYNSEKMHLGRLTDAEAAALDVILAQMGVSVDVGTKKEELCENLQSIIESINTLDFGTRQQLLHAINPSSSPTTSTPRDVRFPRNDHDYVREQIPVHCPNKTGADVHSYSPNKTGTEVPFRKTVSASVVDGEITPLPKLTQFSGAAGSSKGESSYEQFRYEVRCLMKDDNVSDTILMRAVRRAVKGVAFDTLLTLGESVSPRSMLDKFETVFGNILTKEQCLDALHAARQKDDEVVALWACRLETLARQVVEKKAMSESATKELIRNKFWTGLRDGWVKGQTRHKFDDSSVTFEQLVTACRSVESETDQSKDTSKMTATNAQLSQSSLSTLDDKLKKLLLKVDSLETRLAAAEKTSHSKAERISQLNPDAERFAPAGNSYNRFPSPIPFTGASITPTGQMFSLGGNAFTPVAQMPFDACASGWPSYGPWGYMPQTVDARGGVGNGQVSQVNNGSFRNPTQPRTLASNNQNRVNERCCYRCGSPDHLVRYCPLSSRQSEN